LRIKVGIVGTDMAKQPKTLGERVRSAREKKQLGVNELDRMLGTSAGYTSRLERGEFDSVGSDRLDALGTALGVSLDWLVRGEPTDTEAPRTPS
jgi:transcriptional regulator with XRE-family HTH domain